MSLKRFFDTKKYKFSGGPSRFQYVVYSVKEYHNKDLASAKAYIEDAFDRRNFNKNKIEKYLSYISTYDNSYRNHLGEAILISDSISYPMLNNKVILTGKIGRIDLARNNYEIWLFEEDPRTNWKKELRLPLIQNYYAAKFNAPLNEMSVGIYFFSTGEYESVCFENNEVNKSIIEAKKLYANLLKYPKT